MHFVEEVGRFAARVLGLASGLAPAGSAEVYARKGRSRRSLLRTGFAERLERIFGCPCGWRGRHGQCGVPGPVAVTFSWRSAHSARGLRPDLLLAGAAPGARW